jgi:hypothetical protein
MNDRMLKARPLMLHHPQDDPSHLLVLQEEPRRALSVTELVPDSAREEERVVKAES